MTESLTPQEDEMPPEVIEWLLNSPTMKQLKQLLIDKNTGDAE